MKPALRSTAKNGGYGYSEPMRAILWWLYENPEVEKSSMKYLARSIEDLILPMVGGLMIRQPYFRMLGTPFTGSR